MSRIIQRTLVMLTLIVGCSIGAWGQDTFTTDDGITYEITNDDDDNSNYTVTLYSADTGLSGEYKIPKSVDYNDKTYAVTAIGQDAFRGCNIESVEIPYGVTTIVTQAFNECSSLTYVTIPSSVTTIEEEAFIGCTSLTSVTIPSRVTTIGDRAFSSCIALGTVSIEEGVEIIGEAAFYGTALESVTIPSSVETIGASAFSDAALTEVVIPGSVTTIGDEAFSGCTSLVSATIENGVQEIGASAFSGTALTSVVIPGSVTTIGDYAFSNCESLAFIYDYCITKQTIGDGVFDGETVFYIIPEFKDAVIAGNEDLNSKIFTDMPADCSWNSTTITGDPASAGCTSGQLYTGCYEKDAIVGGATPYNFTGLHNDYIYGTEVSGYTMKAGVPYILMATQSAINIYKLPYSDSVESAGNVNGMYGTLNGTTINGNYYFYLGNYGLTRAYKSEFTIPANRCYFDYEEIPQGELVTSNSAKALIANKLITGVNTVEGTTDAVVNVYNMQGVKVRSNVNAENATNDLESGVYIVGGKKIIKK